MADLELFAWRMSEAERATATVQSAQDILSALQSATRRPTTSRQENVHA